MIVEKAFLYQLADRMKAERKLKKLSRRQLAEDSGVSERYLAEFENGRGNLSLVRFGKVCAALQTSMSKMLEGLSVVPPFAVALLGVRGAGKSTVGKKLATQWGVTFVELDKHIEKSVGLSLAQIFDLHGQQYYRQLERECLQKLIIAATPCVIATGGSIATHKDNYELLLQNTFCCWLKAKPIDHWNRVVQQGDHRPMAQRPQAFAELQRIFTRREPLYQRAHAVVDTHNRTIDAVVKDLLHTAANNNLTFASA